ncbi:MAG: tetratricopeptide repeat protein [Gammaproteobacteria bacterium]|nr:tetratricopeptide repeat protein [Gammaproteobacteria bacterium]
MTSRFADLRAQLRPGAYAAAGTVFLMAIAGCSSTTATSRPSSEGQQRADSAVEAPRERSRRDYPEIETDESGFTITEQLRISGEARADYQAALQVLRQERYEQGIAMLLDITEIAPEITAPYIGLGIAYGRKGDLEAAEKALLQALALAPDHPIAHNEIGIVFRMTGRFEEARASYEQALAVHPGFHYARRNLGVLCDLYLADLGCALEHYEAYLQAVAEDPEVAIWVADIRNRIGP